MASLRKCRHCSNWFACFILPDGHRVQRSTGTSKRKQAQRIADTYEEAARRKRTAGQVRKVIADIHEAITGETLAVCTVKAYFDTWLQRKAPELSASTITFYRIKARDFLEYLGDRAPVLEMNGITAADIIGFREREAGRVSATSVNHSVKFLRMVFKSAKRDGMASENPAEFVGTIKNASRLKRRAFTPAELQRILEHCDPEWRSLVLFGLYTGQRLGDLARLTWQNLDLARKEIRLVTAKTGRQMILPILSPLFRHIMTLPAGEDPKAPLHPIAFEVVTREGRVSTLSQQFYEIMADTGLVKVRTHKRRGAEGGPGRRGRKTLSDISFHALRHTATSFMKNAGVSSSIVQEYIGHESEAINTQYTHIDIESLRRAGEALPDIVGK